MTELATRFTARRAAATLLDDASIAAALGVVLGVNVAALRRGRSSPLGLNQHVRLWVPASVTLPAGMALAAMEQRGGSLGKRALGLRLQQWPADPQRLTVPWGRAVTRSLLKTALPWELGHQSVWQFRADKFVSGNLLAAAAYGLLIAQVIGAARPDGRTYADRVAGTVVAGQTEPKPTRRAFSSPRSR